MAKSRVNVKGVNKAVAQLTKDLKTMRRQPVAASGRDLDSLHRRLTEVRALLNECPDPMFNMFAAPGGEPMMAAGARRGAARKKTAKKSSRKGTRKVR